MAKILLVDDDDQFRSLMREILEKEGYEVVEAADGDQAVKLFTKEPTDIVITDIIMPEKEGIETMLELRQKFPDVKIIAISAGGFGGQMNYLDGAKIIGGALKTFTKPFDPNELIEAIEEILNTKNKQTGSS